MRSQGENEASRKERSFWVYLPFDTEKTGRENRRAPRTETERENKTVRKVGEGGEKMRGGKGDLA